MTLQNGYKVIYEKAANGKRTFYASKTGLFSDAELITEATIGEYKLIYEKDGSFYGSVSGIPSDNDHCFEEFKKVFEQNYVEPASVEESDVTDGTEELDTEPEVEPDSNNTEGEDSTEEE